MNIHRAVLGSLFAACVAVILSGAAAAADDGSRPPTPTVEQWIDWGSRVHGGFGVLIAMGIRVGVDALARLGAARREVDVTYFDSPSTPCPCVVDGVMVAVSASPGQKNLRIATEPAAPGYFGEVLVRHRRSGDAVRYCLRAETLSRLLEGQALKDLRARYDLVNNMAAASLYEIVAGDGRCVRDAGADGADTSTDAARAAPN